MGHVNFISCDGCGKKIEGEDMIFVSIVEQSPIKEEEKMPPIVFLGLNPANQVNRKELQYYFHNQDCMHKALFKYAVENGMKIEFK